MKRSIQWLSHLKTSFYRIKLVDRCLIVIMCLLMAQSSYSLFVNEVNSQETSTIDIVMRTTSAAIFGYFLSVNFIKCPRKKAADPSAVRQAASPSLSVPDETTGILSADEASGLRITNKIGFSSAPTAAAGSTAEITSGKAETRNESSETSHQQVIIATFIGLFALCVLIYVRNFCDITAAMLATISQMRDFVSGSVGFLLGSPGSNKT